MIITAHAWALVVMGLLLTWQISVDFRQRRLLRASDTVSRMKDVEIASLSAMLTKRNNEIGDLYKQQSRETKAHHEAIRARVEAEAAIKAIQSVINGPHDYSTDIYPEPEDKLGRITEIIDGYGND